MHVRFGPGQKKIIENLQYGKRQSEEIYMDQGTMTT